MSRQIDERIVELQFNNENFEKGAKQSIETLEKLDKSLNIGGGKSLEPLAVAVVDVGEKFNVLQHIAEGAIEHIGEQAVEAGEQMLKAFTIDQVTAGWSKFEEKTRAVQTIMNATGDSIDTVNGYLEKLMWFTDETSYDFTDMTSNIGKFTAQGVELDKATTAMQGIALWAAKSGQGANEASRAMYNLSQALGVGAVKLTDWMSIENANMATAEFKQLAIDTAKELGVLSESAMTASGKLVDVVSFRENLSEGWFTSDVLIKTLEKYGDYADQLYEIVQASDGELSASEAMKILDQTYQGIGASAFKAGQEAKTFSDVMDATADAVSSKWLAMFEIIFGNYEEAKVMWTDLANTLYDLFAAPLDEINDMLKDWKGMGGRDELIEGIAQAGHNLIKVLDLIHEAWEIAFPPLQAEQLYNLTAAFHNLMQNIELTDLAYENLRDGLAGVLSIFSAIGKVIGAVIKGFTGVTMTAADVLNHLAGGFVAVIGEIGRAILGITDLITSEDNLNFITNTVSSGLGVLSKGFQLLGGGALLGVKTLIDAFGNLSFDLEHGITGIQDFTNSIKMGVSSALGEMGVFSNVVDTIASGIAKASEMILSFFNAVVSVVQAIQADGGYETFFETLSEFGQSFHSENLSNALSALQDGFATLMWKIADFLLGIKDFGTTINQYLEKPMMGFQDAINYFIMRFKELSIMDMVDAAFVAGLTAFAKALGKLFKSLADVLKNLEDLMNPWNNMLDEVSKTLKTMQTKIKADAFVKLATSIAILAGSLLVLSLVPFEKLVVGGAVLVAFAAALTICIKQLDKLELTKEKADVLTKIAGAMVVVSIAIGLLSAAAVKLGSMDFDAMVQGLGSVVVMIAALTAAMIGLSNNEASVTPKDVAGLIALALAIKLLIKPLKELAKFQWEDLVKSLEALGVLIVELSFFAVATQNAAHTFSNGAGVMLLAVGLLELVGVLALIAKFDWEDLGKGLAGLGGILAEVTAAVAIMGRFGSLSGAASMAVLPLFAAGIAELVGVVALAGQLPWQVVATGLIALGGALAIVVGAAAGLTVFGAGLLALAGSIALVNLSVAALTLSFTALLAALPLAAAGIVSFGLLSEDQIHKAFENISVAFKDFLYMLAAMKAEWKLLSKMYMAAFLEGLAEILPHILNGLSVIIEEVLAFIEEYLPSWLDRLMNILDILNDYIDPFVDKVMTFLLKAIVGAIRGVADNIGEIIDALVYLFDKLTEAIMEQIYKLGDWLREKAEELWHNFIDGFTGSSTSGGAKVRNSTERLGDEAVKGFRTSIKAHSPADTTIQAAKDFIIGWVIGTKKETPKVISSAKGLGDTIVEGVKNSLFGKSNPGGEFRDHVVAAIKGGTPKVTSTVTTMGESASEGFSKAVSGTGTKATKTIAQEVEESEDIEKALKEKADKVSEIFSTEFKKIDLSLSNLGYQFDIWKAIQGPEADEAVLQKGELVQAQKELREYAKQYQIAYDNYQYLVANPDLVQSPTELAEKENEYMKYLTEMYKKANEIATMQKEISDEYKDALEIAQEDQAELLRKQASLIPDDFEFSEATKRAYDDYLQAATDSQKQYFYDIWKQLADEDYEAAGVPKIDAEGLKRDVMKELGLDPDNYMEGYLNVEETVKNLIAETGSAYISGLEENYQELIGTYSDTIADGTEKILGDVQEAYPEFKKVGEKMAESAAEGIEDSGHVVIGEAAYVQDETQMEMMRQAPEFEEVGEGMMMGVSTGIANGRSKVIDEAVDVAVSALAAAKSALGIASPSKKFAELGAFSALGFALGIANQKDNVEATATNMADAAVDPIFKLGKRVQDMMDNVDPVLKPVVDLSQVESSIAALDSMWSDTSRKITGDISASEAARSAQTAVATKKEPAHVTYNETFTQNNYSPKALSNIEIYRQTNNQLNSRGRRNLNK